MTWKNLGIEHSPRTQPHSCCQPEWATVVQYQVKAGSSVATFQTHKLKIIYEKETSQGWTDGFLGKVLVVASMVIWV